MGFRDETVLDKDGFFERKDKMDRETLAVERRNKGYNCAQAVLCTYCDLFGVDEKMAFIMSEGLGTGMGCTLATCGALSAAGMLAGMKCSTANLESPNSKGSTYRITREIVKEFKEQAGAVRCRDLKGIETGKVLCECEDCVRIACRLIEKGVL